MDQNICIFADMERLITFVTEHLKDDIARLVLDRKKWPEIDMDLAVNCIESRRKLRGKVQEWYDESRLIFPFKLSAEQCSSSAAARYKAELARRIIGKADGRISDLTGGLGVDSWHFSKIASKVLYNEMQTPLCEAAKHNFAVLGAADIEISNCAVSSRSSSEGTSVEALLGDFRPDLVFMDPARRGEGGKKVFLIEECTPDVLTLKDEIFELCPHLLIKLSPMADITMVCDRLGRKCREVHVVAAGGECKELLIWMDRSWDGGYSITAAELDNEGMAHTLTFDPSVPCEVTYSADEADATFLFEPGKALMKAGAFNVISGRFDLAKLGRSTHYFLMNEKKDELQYLGKTFRIIRTEPLDKRTMKAAGKEFPRSEVTARNIPMDTDALRKRLGVSSGDDAHIFGLKSDRSGNLLIIARPEHNL